MSLLRLLYLMYGLFERVVFSSNNDAYRFHSYMKARHLFVQNQGLLATQDPLLRMVAKNFIIGRKSFSFGNAIILMRHVKLFT